ncbi:ATP-binding protein [Marinactinospora thermotolerans]
MAHTVFSTSLPGTAESVAVARRFATGTLHVAPQGVPAAIVDDVEVIVSDLATNAIRYTQSGDAGGTYDLYLAVHERSLSGSIRTQAPRPPLGEVFPAPDGLLLAQALADECSSLMPYEHGVFFTLGWSLEGERRG